MTSRSVALENGLYPPTEFLSDLKIRKAERIKTDRLNIVIKPVLIIAQFIAVLPLYGVFSNDHSQVRFAGKSLKTFSSILMICVSGLMTVWTIIHILSESITYRGLVNLVFYGSSTLSMILFFRLAIKWEKVMEEWSFVEESMADLKPINNGPRRVNILVMLLIFTSFCEHIFANMETLFTAGQCGGPTQRLFFIIAFKQVFAFTEFRPWKGYVWSFANFFVTMTWNFTDLFLMAMSVALSSKFEQLNKELESVKNKEKPIEYWRKIRETYNKLSLLTKFMDTNLSPTVLVSFTNNLYFICLQLLNSLKPIQSTTKIVYFYVSFGHLLFRTCAVCLTAASIYDNSKGPLMALFSVSSNTYNIEVQRLVSQVNFDNLAMTGCKFFTITRTLMLTVAGTIVTYEIVLVQFNALTSDGSNSDKEVVCPKL